MVKGCFDLRVASKTYQEIFVNISFLIFHRGLEDLLILQCIRKVPISHRSDPSLRPDSHITFEQYFYVVLLYWWKKTESGGGIGSNQFIGCTQTWQLRNSILIKKHYINCLNAWATKCATFRNQKLCCGIDFLHKNNKTKNSLGL